MSRVTIRNGGVLKCDMPKCVATFVTYSVVSKVREQAAADGWARVSGKSVKDRDGHILSTKLVDLCPNCKPKPVNITMQPDVPR